MSPVRGRPPRTTIYPALAIVIAITAIVISNVAPEYTVGIAYSASSKGGPGPTAGRLRAAPDLRHNFRKLAYGQTRT